MKLGLARVLVVVALLFGGTAFVASFVTACAPPRAGDGAGVHVPASTIVDTSCVLLRLAHDARVDEVCATAEELAPFVPDLIAQREESGVDAGDPEGPVVAYAVRDPCTAPKRPRRARDAGAPRLIVRPREHADAAAQ